MSLSSNKNINILFSTVALVLMFAFSSSVSAKIFWFRPGAMSDSFTKAHPGRTEVYNSRISINSGSGRLSVIACEEFIGSVKKWLETNFSEQNTSSRSMVVGDGMIAGVFERQGKVYRVVALDLGVYSQTMVFWVEQDVEEYRKSQAPPDISTVRSFHVFPGSSLELSVADENRGVKLAMFSAFARVDDATSFYHSALSGDGWTRLLGSDNILAGMPGINVYSKGGDIRCVLIREGARPGKSCITVLHKGMDVR